MTKIIKILKTIMTGFAKIISIFFIPLGWLASKLGRFVEVSVILGYFPFYLGEKVRYFYYKSLLNSVGENVIFKFGSHCQYRNISIGDNVLVGFNNTLGEVSIGDDVLIGSNVIFTSGVNQHGFDNENLKIREHTGERKMIFIDSDVWIGNNCVVCADVGKRSVIGAGAIVISRTEGHGVYVGNPAKFIKKID